MNNRSGQGLAYRNRWLCVGAGLVLLAVYLSVTDLALPQYPSTIGDKINHFLAYGLLMGWFGQLFLRWPHRLLIALSLLALGIAMEFLQGTMPHRFFGWWDVVANTIGIVVALLALASGADRILIWFEGWACGQK